MEGYYLIKNEDGCYEFDLNIMKKIMFQSLAKKSASYVHRMFNAIAKMINQNMLQKEILETWKLGEQNVLLEFKKCTLNYQVKTTI